MNTDQTSKKELILKKKRRINKENLCKGLSQKFAVYFDYIHSLNFDEKLKYFYLHKIFYNLFVHKGFNYDHVYN